MGSERRFRTGTDTGMDPASSFVPSTFGEYGDGKQKKNFSVRFGGAARFQNEKSMESTNPVKHYEMRSTLSRGSGALSSLAIVNGVTCCHAPCLLALDHRQRVPYPAACCSRHRACEALSHGSCRWRPKLVVCSSNIPDVIPGKLLRCLWIQAT
jgi:hypothetical protein